MRAARLQRELHPWQRWLQGFLGFRVQDLGFRIKGLGLRAEDLGFRAQDLGFRFRI